MLVYIGIHQGTSATSPGCRGYQRCLLNDPIIIMITMTALCGGWVLKLWGQYGRIALQKIEDEREECIFVFAIFVCLFVFCWGGGAIDDHWGNIHIVHTSLASSPLPPSHPNPPNSLSPPPPPPQPTPLPLAASLSSLLQRCHGDQEMWEYRCPSEKESKREWRRRLRVWGGREGWKKGKEGGWAEDQWLNAHLKLV